MISRSLAAASTLLLLAATACGSTVEAPGPTTTDPAAGDPTSSPAVDPPTKPEPKPPVAEDPVDPVYPTKHTPMPLVDQNGGGIMESIKVVTVTFPNEARKDLLEEFGDTITQTPWWDAVSAGYCVGTSCVGRGTSGGHVVMAEAPSAAYTDTSRGATGANPLQAYIQSKITSGALPPPERGTLYAFYFPTGTTITLDGSKSCQSFGAYHNSMDVTAPDGAVGWTSRVAYAVMPRCGNSLDTLTTAASHELIEAATDPFVGHNDVAFYMRNQAWATQGGEVGDLCANTPGYREGKFAVQRSWSNKAAALSHDPCVPYDSTDHSYYNVAPEKGGDAFSLKAGDKKTITLTAFSDAPMSDWSIDVIDFTTFQGGTSALDFEIDKTEVHNGSKILLTVTASSSINKYALYGVVSRKGQEHHIWPMVVYAK